MPRQTRRAFLKTSGALLGGMAIGSTVTAATSTDRFIVDSISESDLSGTDLSVVHDLSSVGYMVVEGPMAAVDALGASYAPDTIYTLDLPVQEAPVPQASDATDEPLYALQWDKQAQDISSAHDVTRGEGTRVSVIDTGVTASHPDLAHAVNATLSRDFTGDGQGAPGPHGGYHGTHVAGIIAANDQNDAGVVGTAPATEVIDCRVFSTGAGASFADIFAAIVYSVEIGCDVANLSLGAYPIERQAIGSFYGKALNTVTAYAQRNDTLLVIAAGNDAADLQHDKNFISLPNEAANVMSIAATGPLGFGWGDDSLEAPPESPAFYTNYGTNAIDIAAPGGNADLSAIGSGVPWYLDLVLSTMPTGYGWAAGTSMACPQVVGAAALVKSLNPEYSANNVRSALNRTASVPSGYDKTYYGSGFVDVNAALRD